MKKEVSCFHCGDNAFVENKGIIYVRAKVDDKWKNVPCCYPCWQMKYRGVKKEDVKPNMTQSLNDQKTMFDPMELLKKIQETSDDKKFEMLMKNLPEDILELKVIAKMIYQMTKRLNGVNTEYVCPEFTKLNDLANEDDTKDFDDPDQRKHRRACMAHPFNCEHKHCKGLTQFLISTGMDKIVHPDYGSMNKAISKEEEESVEDNR